MLVMLVAKAYAQLVAVGLRLQSLDVSERLASADVATGAQLSIADDEERAIARAQHALRLAERFYPMRVACLQRSLVLQRLLAPLGIDAALRIGVRKDRAELNAHAWLEYKGRAINTDRDHRGTFAMLHPVRAKDEQA